MTGEIVYVAELNIAPADLPVFSAWYAGRHAPDLYQLGFRTCTSYRAWRVRWTSSTSMRRPPGTSWRARAIAA